MNIIHNQCTALQSSFLLKFEFDFFRKFYCILPQCVVAVVKLNPNRHSLHNIPLWTQGCPKHGTGPVRVTPRRGHSRSPFGERGRGVLLGQCAKQWSQQLHRPKDGHVLDNSHIIDNCIRYISGLKL